MDVSLNESQINLEGYRGNQGEQINPNYQDDPYEGFYSSQQRSSPQNFYPIINDSGPRAANYPNRSNITQPRNVYQFEEG